MGHPQDGTGALGVVAYFLMPIIAVISALPAILAVSQPGDGGRVVVLVDTAVPRRRVLAMARPLLAEAEREELGRVLTK
jgi:hypothetical protein